MLNLTGGGGVQYIIPLFKIVGAFAESLIHNGEVMSVQNY